MIKHALLNYKKQSKKVYLNTKNFFKPEIFVKLADSNSEIKQAQKLRYQVFFSDRNKKKILNISNFRKDSDKYDSYCDHIIVNYKHSKFSKNKVIGTYRLLQQKIAEKKIGFYTSEEFCLDKLIQSYEYTNMLELSRSCISQKFRNRNVLKLMWREIYNYINTNKIDGMFGTASFLEIDIQKINNQLLFLQQNYKMPENIRVKARKNCRAKIDYSKNIELNLKLVKSLPTLIKGYIKLNAYIGDGAVIDYKFKTTDVFVFLPSNKINKEYVEKIVWSMFSYFVKKISKIDHIKDLYKKNYDELKRTDNFWTKIIEYLNIKYTVNSLENIPSKGPVIVVCNHPFGLLDGLIVAAIIANIRKDYKILINEEITQIDLIEKYLIPIKFSEIIDDIKKNIKSKKSAINFINNGGSLILFPSGEVATSSFIFDKPKERKWKPLVGSIIKKTECKIVPIYFKGKNSVLFQTVGFFSDQLRRSLFIRELFNKKNNNYFLKIGNSINSNKFKNWNSNAIADYLKDQVLKLN